MRLIGISCVNLSEDIEDFFGGFVKAFEKFDELKRLGGCFVVRQYVDEREHEGNLF